MSIKQIYNLLTGKIKVKKKAKLSFANIKAVLQSFKRSHSRIPYYIREQIIWRRLKVIDLEPRCWESGYCIVCGCDILGKTMEDRACSAEDVGDFPCYLDMMDKEKWENYKIDNKIKLFTDVSS